ncbi:MAG: SIR2 family protein [Deltaproteobacteria bacterium]|uniref:SIR2 family protein n=1 Tax=Candidatus Zymogenus saltonus TaxID=2844893 RepID=A0A9D8KB92_9DELT|nr:SIR2 family protein [Candidatus Zymogenus saltonus]
MAILILGAGFSKWAANLPLANSLFDFAIEPDGVQEENRLHFVRDIKASWDYLNPNKPVEAFIDFAMHQSKKTAKLVVWYIVRRLSEPYIWKERHAGRWRRHVFMIDENRRFERPGVKKAQNLLTNTFGMYLQGIITTNYDMLVEYALGSRGFNYGVPGEILTGRGAYPVSNSVTLTGKLPLAKIHGSISWQSDIHYTDGRRGLTGNALVLAPVQNKIMPQELKGQWQLSARLLNGASRLVVFGFAFNTYDTEFLEHLRIHSKAVKNVLIIDIMPNIDTANEVFTGASIETMPPPPESEVDIRKWLIRSP